LPAPSIRPLRFFRACLPLAAAAAVCGIAPAQDAAPDPDRDADAARAKARTTFDQQVVPFLQTHCSACHEKKQKGGITFLYAKRNPGSPAFRRLWTVSASHVEAETMPPEDEPQPTPDERRMFRDWVDDLKHLSPKDPGVFTMRRLTKTELGNTLRDLFGVPPDLVRDLPDEVSGAGYLNSLSPALLEQYLDLANRVLEHLPPSGDVWPAAFFGPAPDASADPEALARQVARSLARRAYRRPPSEAEIDVLLRVHALARDHGRSPAEARRLMLKAVLVSPQFLFLTPVPVPDGAALPAIVPLDDHQLASRLSYALWATLPDAELSALADAGTLHEPPVLRAQARRLLADPRSRALFDGFGAQWLGLDRLAEKTFDAAKFPEMTPALRTAMYDEARLLFADLIHHDRRVSALVDADHTFLNESLASLYGLEGRVTGPAMRRVALADPNRGGILTLPGVLATTSFPDRTSPVNRGVWVLEQVLGEHVPPAPPNVPTLEQQDAEAVAGLTLRQRTERHRTDPTCANCHRILDPIGFGLENFDAIGRWRDADEAGGKIDASGELPGNRSFASPRDLKRILAAREDDLCRNLTAKLLAYALGRPLEGHDEVVVDQLTRAIAADDYRLQSWVVAVVTSYPFTHRRTHE
jgi:mono/diheme cytochrome c family protein